MKLKTTLLFNIIFIFYASSGLGKGKDLYPNDSVIINNYSFQEGSGILEIIDSLIVTPFMEHTYYDIIVGKVSNGIFIEIEDSGDPNDIIDRILYNHGYYQDLTIVGCVQYKGIIMIIVNLNVTDACINMFFKREFDKKMTLFRQKPPVSYDPINDTWFFYHHPLYFLYLNGKFIPAEKHKRHN